MIMMVKAKNGKDYVEKSYRWSSGLIGEDDYFDKIMLTNMVTMMIIILQDWQDGDPQLGQPHDQPIHNVTVENLRCCIAVLLNSDAIYPHTL